jgi:hypothetical protein
MVHAGALVSIVMDAVRTTPQVSLSANKQEYDLLVLAGASDRDATLIMNAIERRLGPDYRYPGDRGRRGESLIVPEQTEVRLRLARNLSSAHARTGDTIHFEVLKDVCIKNKFGNFLIIERGAPAWGTITDANPTRMGRAGNVEVTIDFVTLANGKGDKIALTATEPGDRHGHAGVIVTIMATAGLVYSSKDPAWLPTGGKESTIKEGVEFMAKTPGEANLDSSDFEQR